METKSPSGSLNMYAYSCVLSMRTPKEPCGFHRATPRALAIRCAHKKGGIPHEKTPPVVSHRSSGPGGVASRRDTVRSTRGIALCAERDAHTPQRPHQVRSACVCGRPKQRRGRCCESVVIGRPRRRRWTSIPEIGPGVKGISRESLRKSASRCNQRGVRGAKRCGIARRGRGSLPAPTAP